MRKMISMLLVLVLCLYLPCTAFAVSSPGSDGSAPTTPPYSTPQTGDTFMPGLWLAVMLLALLAMVALVIGYRKISKK